MIPNNGETHCSPPPPNPPPPCPHKFEGSLGCGTPPPPGVPGAEPSRGGGGAGEGDPPSESLGLREAEDVCLERAVGPGRAQKGLLPGAGQGEPRGEKRVFSSPLGEHVSEVTATATPVPSLSRGGVCVCEAEMVFTSSRERSTTHSGTPLLGLGVCGGQRACGVARDPEEPNAPGVWLGLGLRCQRLSSRGLCSKGLGAAGGVSKLGEAVREPYCASEANADDSGISTGVTTTCWPTRHGGVRGGVHVRVGGERDTVG